MVDCGKEPALNGIVENDGMQIRGLGNKTGQLVQLQDALLKIVAGFERNKILIVKGGDRQILHNLIHVLDIIFDLGQQLPVRIMLHAGYLALGIEIQKSGSRDQEQYHQHKTKQNPLQVLSGPEGLKQIHQASLLLRACALTITPPLFCCQ
ncbi:hypothetical protein D3C76_1147120 [compost metagenome]